jgi:hypothetical protein
LTLSGERKVEEPAEGVEYHRSERLAGKFSRSFSLRDFCAFVTRLARAFRYYRHRFRYKRHFGQVTWLLQAFSKWWQVTDDRDFADMVFEIADWLLGYQQDKTGAFINDHQSDTPGYTTAVYLEGIAAALHLANSLKDQTRQDAYLDSLTRGFGFLDRLIIQDRDRSILPNIDWALGGLRQGIHYSEIRTDFVQHSLSAILNFQKY